MITSYRNTTYITWNSWRSWKILELDIQNHFRFESNLDNYDQQRRWVPRLHFILFKYHWKTCRKTAESVSKQKYWFFLYFPHFFCPQFAKETLYTKLALMHHLRDPDPSLASVLTISILSILRQSTIYSWGPKYPWKCGKKITFHVFRIHSFVSS